MVIDAGSSKALIGQAAAKYLKKNKFIGCHPMAGSEKSGVENASCDLFEGSVCFVASRQPMVEQLWKALGSKTILISAKEHDRVVAEISHMPHALAFSLFQTPKKIFSGAPVNPSLKEPRRLAQSSAGMWADIFSSNADEILKHIVEFEKKGLIALKNLLRKKDRSGLERFIQHANQNAK